MKDAEALDPSRTEYVGAVAPQIERTANVTYRNESANVSVVGTTPEFQTVRSFEPEYGEFFSSGDVSSIARVAVLGSDTQRASLARQRMPCSRREGSTAYRSRLSPSWQKKGAGASEAGQQIIS